MTYRGAVSWRSEMLVLRRRVVVGLDVLQHLLEVELVDRVAADRARQWCSSLSWSGVTGYFTGGGFFRLRAMA